MQRLKLLLNIRAVNEADLSKYLVLHFCFTITGVKHSFVFVLCISIHAEMSLFDSLT